jgi:hypothetical protein
MKQYLTPGLFLLMAAGASAASAQAVATVAQPVPYVPAAVPSDRAAAPATSGPRQLSAEERAVLRKQLYQYSRLSGRGS